MPRQEEDSDKMSEPSSVKRVPHAAKVAAAPSAAVTSTHSQRTAPTQPGRASRKENSSLFSATLRERGAGGEALLLEKRPLPQSLGMNVMVSDVGYVLLRNGLDGQPNLLQMASLVFQS